MAGPASPGEKPPDVIEVFVRRTVEALGRDAAAGWTKELKALKAACDAFNERPFGGLAAEGVLAAEEAERVCEPLLLACASRQPKLAGPALSCLHKLVAGGCLRAESPPLGAPPVAEGEPAPLAVRVVDAISKCADMDAAPHEGVQLGVIQALLSSATSPSVRLHGEALLRATRSIYNLVLIGTSEANQATARGALFQVVHTAVKRFIAVARDGAPSAATANAAAVPPPTPARPGAADAGGAQADALMPTADELKSLRADESLRGLEAVFKEGEGASTDEATTNGASAASEGSVGASPADSAAVAPTSAGASPQQMSVEEADARLLLHTLCKLAVRQGDLDEDMYLLKSKALALDILRQLFETSQASQWIQLRASTLRKPLCFVLLRCGGVSTPPIFQLTTQVFTALLMGSRAYLKAELGLIYPLLVLRPLERADVPQSMVMSALRLVRRICTEEQLLVDLYVNYDCDLSAQNLFARTAAALESVQAHPGAGPSVALAAGQCMLALLRSLQVWAASRGELAENSLQSQWSVEPAQSPTSVAARDPAPADEAPSTPTPSGGRGDRPTSQESGEAARFAALREEKRARELAVTEFNRKPIKAMAALRDSGALGDSSALTAARWLRESVGLDVEAIGEFLGHHGEDEMEVMHAYMTLFDFTGLSFDAALRRFLACFRLPGEAQKIDRLMEAFAGRFCACNPGVFGSEDAAYILAFAVIMLNTDLHNPAMEGEERMSLDSFVAMGTSAEEAAGLSHEMLAAIYDSILRDEIAMPGQPAHQQQQAEGRLRAGSTRLSAAFDFAMPWRRRREREDGAQAESDVLLAQTRALFAGDSDKAVYSAASEPGLARPMLETAGKALVGTLRAAFEGTQDGTQALAPLEGARAAVRLAAAMELPALRDDLVAFLAAAPGLDDPANFGSQHAEALTTLLALAGREGRALGESWGGMLRAVSRLEELRELPQQPTSTDGPAPAAPPKPPSSPMLQRLQRTTGLVVPASPRRTVMGGAFANGAGTGAGSTAGNGFASALPPAAMEQLGGWLRESGGTAIDRVFASSVGLDSEEVLHFATALAAVSKSELWPSVPGMAPRLFSLQKLVEMAHSNLGRVRMVWAQLWVVVADHLVSAAAHDKVHIATYAVDSLRQIASRVLRRAIVAGANASHAEEAFRPFASVLRRATNAQARELAVQSVSQMLVSHPTRDIGVGWKAALMVLSASASDAEPSVFAVGLAAVESANIEELPADCIVDAINALNSFVSAPVAAEDASVRALGLMRRSASALAAAASDELAAFGWVPLIAGLADLSADPRATLADAALETLFAVLREHGGSILDEVWRRAATSALLPLLRFDGGAEESDNRLLWLAGRVERCMPPLAELLGVHPEPLRFLHAGLIAELGGLAAKTHQEVVRSAAAGLTRLAREVGAALAPRDWDALVAALAAPLYAPSDVPPVAAAAAASASEGPKATVTDVTARDGAVARLLVLRALGEVHESCMRVMPLSAHRALLEALREGWEAAATKGRQVRQEAYGGELYIKALRRAKGGALGEVERCDRLGAACEQMLQHFPEDEHVHQRAALVASALAACGELAEPELAARLPQLYPAAAALVDGAAPAVRHAVAALLVRLAPIATSGATLRRAQALTGTLPAAS